MEVSTTESKACSPNERANLNSYCEDHMSLKVTFSFPTVAEAAALLARIAEVLPETAVVTAEPVTEAVAETPAPAASEAVTKPAARKGRPPRALPPVAAPAEPAPTEPSPAASSSPAPVETPSAAAPTRELAQAKLEAVFEKSGFSGAQALLAHVGAQRLREVADDKLADMIAYADQTLAQ
jgi:hypothetical protein